MEKGQVTRDASVVKIVINDEVRKYRDITSYNKLILALARTIGYQHLNCRFMYVDDDGDEITVSNEDDLGEAFNFFAPKVPRLNLVSYDDQPDLSLSGVKLCESMLDENPSKCEIVKKDSEADTHRENLGQNEKPQAEKIDNSIVEFSVISDDKPKEQSFNEPKEEEKDTQDHGNISTEFEKFSDGKQEPAENLLESVISESPAQFEPDSSSQISEQHDDTLSEVNEDRIQPAVINPAPVTNEQKEGKSDGHLSEDQEDRIKIADQDLIDFSSLKSKVTELTQEHMSILLPKIFAE